MSNVSQLPTVSETGFIVRVPEAESRVRSLRDRFHPVARLGVPAHVTVLFPFMDPKTVNDDVLRQIRDALADARGFEFALTRVGRFPLTAFLTPEPAAPFIQLTQRLAGAFPAFPPFGGQFQTIIPHLTVAHGDPAQAEFAEAELSGLMATDGSIQATCRSVELLENSSGVWKQMHVFPLSDAQPPG